MTLIWHIDGAPTIKSKRLEIWLITALVVELGLWYGPEKPDLELFQISFTQQVSNLMRNGFTVDGITFHLRVQSELADLPAKAASLMMTQYNGEYGCSVCYHPGEHNAESNPWIYKYYPYVSTRRALRTHEEVL